MRVAVVLLVVSLSACAAPAKHDDAPAATPRAAVAASCIGPQLQVRPVDFAPGATPEVAGSELFMSCADTIVNGEFPATADPRTGLTVLLVQGIRHWTLATDLAARPDGTLRLQVTVPEDVRLLDGSAQVAVAGVGSQVVIVRR